MRLTKLQLKKMILEAIQEEMGYGKSVETTPCKPEELKAGTCVDERYEDKWDRSYRVGDYFKIQMLEDEPTLVEIAENGKDTELKITGQGDRQVVFLAQIVKAVGNYRSDNKL